MAVQSRRSVHTLIKINQHLVSIHAFYLLHSFGTLKKFILLPPVSEVALFYTASKCLYMYVSQPVMSYFLVQAGSKLNAG